MRKRVHHTMHKWHPVRPQVSSRIVLCRSTACKFLHQRAYVHLAARRWVRHRAEQRAIHRRRLLHPDYADVVDEHILALCVGQTFEKARLKRSASRRTAVC
jgi:hypothetical protein